MASAAEAPDARSAAAIEEAARLQAASRALLDEVIGANPHCAQLRAAAARPFLAEALRPRVLGAQSRFMDASWPRMRYCKRPDAERSSCHWGQLKLFECELKCLTDLLTSSAPQPGWSKSAPSQEGGRPAPDGTLDRVGGGRAGSDTEPEGPLIVYVGAAPGRHVPSLVRRFPTCCFELYDPAAFDESLVSFAAGPEAAGRVTLVRGFFDEAAAAALAARTEAGGRPRPMVFFSDIRTADEQLMKASEVEMAVKRDMERQKAWVETLKPDLAMLKFRLPWGPGSSRYLRGRLMVQAFPPCTSTETRLLTTRADLERGEDTYDQEEYEERLMHHNTVVRSQLHDTGVAAKAVAGMDRCFDCAALADTARRYVALRDGVTSERVAGEAVAAEVSAILAEVGAASGRTLATSYHVSSSRHAGRQFARRRYTDRDGNDHFEVRAGTRRRTSTGQKIDEQCTEQPPPES